MEPTSIIGLISSSASILALCTKVVYKLHVLREKYDDTERTLESVEEECTALNAAMTLIDRWISKTLINIPDHDEQVANLSLCFTTFNKRMEVLHMDIDNIIGYKSTNPGAGLGVAKQRFSKTAGIPITLGRRAKITHVWNETIMKGHLEEVRWQSQHMQLLLSATHLCVYL